MANLERRRCGQLDAHVITAEPKPKRVAVFCHGFGAPADDLVPIGAHLLQRFPQLLDTVEMIFPAAPLSLVDYGMPTGRAWWPLDLDRLTGSLDGRNFDEMRVSIPPGFEDARRLLLGAIADVLKRHGLGPDSLILGGFSQGAMITTDVALHLESPPGGLVIWSGAMINEADWTSRAAQLKDVPVVQSHGRADPILAFKTGTWVRDMLTAHGANLNFIEFDGSHTIPAEAINAAGQLISDSISE